MLMFFLRVLMYWPSTLTTICCLSSSLVSAKVVCMALSLCHLRIASFAQNGSVVSSLGVLGFFGLLAAAGGSDHEVSLLMVVYSVSHSRPIEQLLIVNNTFNRISYTILHPKLLYQWIPPNYAPSTQHPISRPLLMVNYCNFHPSLHDIEDRKISHKTYRTLESLHRKMFLKTM